MTRFTFGLVLAVTCAFSSAISAEQTPQMAQPQGTGVIGGRLLSSDRAQPLRKAQVRIVSAQPRISRTTTTDAEGQFVFDKVAAAEYTLSASKAGYLEMTYGARRAGTGVPGSPVRVTEGQKIENLSFVLPKGSVITGVILDEFGDPAMNTTVRALRYSVVNGQRTLVPAGTSAPTDDRGVYRVSGLMPGEYLVTAVPRDTSALAVTMADVQKMRAIEEAMVAAKRSGAPQERLNEMAEAYRAAQPAHPAPSPTGYVPVYFPGVIQPGAASRVRVGVSEEVPGIDMRLQIIEAGVVTGTVAADVPLPGEVIAMLIDPAMPVANVGVWFRTAGKDGRFSFYGVVPGQYVLRARAGLPPTAPGGAGELTASRDIVVSVGTPIDHTLKIERGVTVSGSLAIDSIRVPVDWTKTRVELYPIPSTGDWEMPIWREAPDADGRFNLKGVVPGRFRVNVSGLPAGWSVASAVFDGRDAADHHLMIEAGRPREGGVIKFTDQSSEISGALSNAMGAGAPGYIVLAFPADNTMWLPMSRRIVVAQTGADGRYSLRGLPAGDYRVATLLDPEAGSWFDREFLAQLVGGAVSVTLSTGEKRTQDFKIR